MNSAEPTWEKLSTAPVVPAARLRKLAKVPFVELADGRLQGVVSSGSDVERVYVSSIAARDHAYHCSTNNNRPCGGLRGHLCNHLRALVTEAVLQYGIDRVARYLGVELDDPAAGGPELIAAMRARHEPTAASTVFSRFLRHLTYLELPAATAPIPDLHWFPATQAVR